MHNVFVYNTLTQSKQRLQSEGTIKIYCCGPTVYADAHLGNFRPPVFFDCFSRFLRYLGYPVKMVSNVTDIDDKIIAAAKASGQSESEISSYYLERYLLALDLLNVVPLAQMPRVTQTIPEIIELIETLISKGHAYEVDGNVYFRVRDYGDYATLSNMSLDQLRSGARVEENSDKEDPMDFALWKRTDVGLSWEAPFSRGRPGWHTECVAMIEKVFGGPVTIHGGGFDLKFPHHSNELAQAWAGYGHHLADIWMHLGFLNMKGEKMSKSLGNILTGLDAISQYSGNAVRHLLLGTHYRAPVVFSGEAMEGAVNEVRRILGGLTSSTFYLLRHYAVTSLERAEQFTPEWEQFLGFLADDFNVANALSVVYDVVTRLNVAMRGNQVEECERMNNVLYQMVQILGYKYQDPTLDKDDLELLAEYELARTNKDFQKSDQLRKKLNEKGIL